MATLDPLAIWQEGRRVVFFQNAGYEREDYQWHLHNTGQDSKLFYTGGFQYSTPGGGYDLGLWPNNIGAIGQRVGMVDSGVDRTHPDLSAVWFVGRSFNTRNNVDTADWSDWDQFSHGTSQAGIIAARTDGNGISGITRCQLLVARTRLSVQDDGGPQEAADAITWLVNSGARVICLPWGTYYYHAALVAAFYKALQKDVLICCSTKGTTGPFFDYPAYPDYPSSWVLPHVLSVCSLDRSGNWESGALGPGVVGAPGWPIVTTRKGGGYHYVSGSSPAAACAAGVAAIIRARHPTLRASELKLAFQACQTTLRREYSIPVIRFPEVDAAAANLVVASGSSSGASIS